jgi:hypothetical protein
MISEHKILKVICMAKSLDTTDANIKTSKSAARHTENFKVFRMIPSEMFVELCKLYMEIVS